MNEQLSDILEKYLNETGDIPVYANNGNGNENYLIFDSTNDSKRFIDFVKEEFNNEELDVEQELNFEVVYSDEYFKCDCGNIIHKFYDDYYIDDDDNVVCLSCFNKSYDLQLEYMEDKINDSKDANKLLDDLFLANRGFIKLNKEYVNGLHQGDDDNPEEIFKELQKKYSEIIFSIDNSDYFTTSFSVWVRDEIN